MRCADSNLYPLYCSPGRRHDVFPLRSDKPVKPCVSASVCVDFVSLPLRIVYSLVFRFTMAADLFTEAIAVASEMSIVDITGQPEHVVET